jgi:dihydrodipicolinate synthase/N-acetylneuraminate lyase
MQPTRMQPGVYPSAVTPHRRDGHEADYGAMLELVDFLGRPGTQGVCLLGETGEFLNIRISDRVRLVHLAVKRCRVPIVAGVSHSTLDGALELASEAVGSGVGGLLIMPPYFFRYDQDDLIEFYRQFAAQIPQRVPILLDHVPQFASEIQIGTVRKLAETGRFSGIKDSSGNLGYLDELLHLQKESGFQVFYGGDCGYSEVRRRGVEGVMSGAAGVAPELYVALERAVQERSVSKIELLECKIEELTRWMDRFPAPVIAKTAVALRKLKTGPLAVPLSVEKDAMLVEFQQWFLPWLESLKHVT